MNTISRAFQETDDLQPAARIVPVFCLRGALHADADIGLRNRPAVVRQMDARRLLGRLDAEDIPGTAMQPDETEVARLVHAILVVEEQAHAVGRVVTLGLDLLVSEEGDVRINVAKQRDQPLGHAAGELAAMLLLELHCIGKPADRVAERADRKLDQHLAAGGGIVVRDELLVLLPHFEPEAHEIALAAVDAPALELGLKKDVPGIKVAQLYPPGMLALREQDPATAVEIETEAPR